MPINETLTFTATSESRMCVNIILLSDSVTENRENFSVIVTSSDSSAEFISDQVYVVIIDNDSKLALATRS